MTRSKFTEEQIIAIRPARSPERSRGAVIYRHRVIAAVVCQSDNAVIRAKARLVWHYWRMPDVHK
jgi:hypothetical protein